MAQNFRLELTNDALGSRNLADHFVYQQTGNFTAVASPNGPIVTVTHPNGARVTNVVLSCLGSSTSTDRTLTADVQRVRPGVAPVSILSTLPAFANTALGGANGGANTSALAGTGVTQAVLKTDGSAELIAGDQLQVVITVSGSNGTIGTGASVSVDVNPYAV